MLVSCSGPVDTTEVQITCGDEEIPDYQCYQEDDYTMCDLVGCIPVKK